MTTLFDSFDESSLGGFAESALGVRNPLRGPAIVGMQWINKAKPYHGDVELYDAHIAAFRELVRSTLDTTGIRIRAGVMWVQQGGDETILLPPDRLFPSDVFTLFGFTVPTTIQTYLLAFDVLSSDFTVNTLAYETAETATLTRRSLQPTFNEWVAAMITLHPDLEPRDFGDIQPDEEWVDSFRRVFLAALP